MQDVDASTEDCLPPTTKATAIEEGRAEPVIDCLGNKKPQNPVSSCVQIARCISARDYSRLY